MRIEEYKIYGAILTLKLKNINDCHLNICIMNVNRDK